MSVPPFASAFVGQDGSFRRSGHLLINYRSLEPVTMICAWISDHYRCRGLVTIFSSILSIVGFTMYFSGSNWFLPVSSFAILTTISTQLHTPIQFDMGA